MSASKDSAAPDESMKILIGRVHHMDPARSTEQMKGLNQVIEVFDKENIEIVDLIDVWFQPSFAGRGSDLKVRLAAAAWEFEQEHFSMVEFRRRRQLQGPLPMRKWVKVLRKSVKAALDISRSRELERHAFVEKVVAGKHLHVWTSLANAEVDGAVVFEDDFQIPSSDSVHAVVELVKTSGKTVDLIDLAGGYSWAELGIQDTGEVDLTTNFLVANTACAYYISSRLARTIVETVVARPDLVRLGVDFLIPYMNRTRSVWKTVLPAVPPLIHGSFHGGVQSAIRP